MQAVSGWSVNYASTGAPTGQTPAHAPQEMHAPSSTLNLPSPSEIALTGHSLSHAPQLIHSSLIIYANIIHLLSSSRLIIASKLCKCNHCFCIYVDSERNFTLNTNILHDAWALLEQITPIKADCGLYCGHACCLPDEDGQGGVLLFPGESEMIDPLSWGHIEHTDAGDILVCAGACERSLRPLGCRIFPLTPEKKKDGTWGVKLDRRAWAICPLMRSGLSGLTPAFRNAVQDAVHLIASSVDGDHFLNAWSETEAAYGEPL